MNPLLSTKIIRFTPSLIPFKNIDGDIIKQVIEARNSKGQIIQKHTDDLNRVFIIALMCTKQNFHQIIIIRYQIIMSDYCIRLLL